MHKSPNDWARNNFQWLQETYPGEGIVIDSIGVVGHFSSLKEALDFTIGYDGYLVFVVPDPNKPKTLHQHYKIKKGED